MKTLDQCKKLQQALETEAVLNTELLTTEMRNAITAQLTLDQEYQDKIHRVYGEEHPMSWQPEQDLILAGPIAWFGGNYLSTYRREELKQTFPAFFLKQLVQQTGQGHPIPEPKLCRELGVTAMHPVAEGGMFRTIYDCGKQSRLGFVIHYEDIPIRQETIEICEFFDLDPWELYSGNSVILVAEHGLKLMDELGSRGFETVRIGRLTRKLNKEVWHQQTPSGINRPKPDALLQLMKREIL